MNKKAIHWGKIYVYLTKNGYINKLLQLDTKKISLIRHVQKI